LKPGRASAEEITLFKSVGVAVQDAAAAGAVLEAAQEMGLGTEVAL
ncbi:MAG: ornithine cyclodeaminase family protein, partial [Dehalococcoidia bacterium]